MGDGYPAPPLRDAPEPRVAETLHGMWIPWSPRDGQRALRWANPLAFVSAIPSSRSSSGPSPGVPASMASGPHGVNGFSARCPAPDAPAHASDHARGAGSGRDPRSAARGRPRGTEDLLAVKAGGLVGREAVGVQHE
jgi:hypothetical protein